MPSVGDHPEYLEARIEAEKFAFQEGYAEGYEEGVTIATVQIAEPLRILIEAANLHLDRGIGDLSGAVADAELILDLVTTPDPHEMQNGGESS